VVGVEPGLRRHDGFERIRMKSLAASSFTALLVACAGPASAPPPENVPITFVSRGPAVALWLREAPARCDSDIGWLGPVGASRQEVQARLRPGVDVQVTMGWWELDRTGGVVECAEKLSFTPLPGQAYRVEYVAQSVGRPDMACELRVEERPLAGGTYQPFAGPLQRSRDQLCLR
jgi:hypothetical protein